MLNRRGFAAGGLGAMALAGIPSGPARAQERLSIAIEWAFQSLHAFLHAANREREFERRNLAVHLNRGFGSLNTVNRVAAGEVDVGFGDLNVALTYNMTAESERRVIIFAPIYDESEAAIVALASETRIPADLRRQRLAAPAGVSARLLFPMFAAANGLQPGDVVWQNVTPNLRELALAKRQVAGIAGSVSTMLPLLRASGVPTSDLQIFRYPDYGVDLLGFGFFARVDTIRNREAALTSFAAGVYAGVRNMLLDPTRGIEALASVYPYIDREVEAYRWQIARDVTMLNNRVRQSGIGSLAAERLANRLEAIARIASRELTLRPGDVFTDRFMPQADLRRVPA